MADAECISRVFIAMVVADRTLSVEVEVNEYGMC